MLRVVGHPRRVCDGVTRREALTVGTLTALSGGFPRSHLLAAEERRTVDARLGKAKSVIHLYLHGGAPTQDMFDLKPAAPVGIRGEFQPIDTNVPGIQICEHLPRMARWMHRCAIVRTVHHNAGCHNTLPSFTGDEQPVDINNPNPKGSFPPAMGAVCEFLKPSHIDLPHYVVLPNYLGWGGLLHRPGPQAGFLGKRYDPLCSVCTPATDPHPPEGRKPMWLGTPTLADAALNGDSTLDRLNSRRSLLQQFDDHVRLAAASLAADSVAQYDQIQQRAFRLMTESTIKAAFQLDTEDPRLVDRYGRNLVGASVLIARRLVEAGVRFIDVYWDFYENRIRTSFDPYWDTHDNNFIRLKQCNLPNLDQTFDALMTDLDQRGLLDETLVVLSSDFGRTPRVNATAGRDHWTHCYSVLLAGAGIKGGTLCGTSDALAAYVADRPTRPADICATIYRCLGIDPELLIHDRSGRPIPIAHGGEPIGEILV